MKILTSFYLGLIALGTSTMSSFSAADVDVRVGYIEFPPVFSTDLQGRPVGTLIDLTRRVLERAELSYSMHSYPTKRMIKYLIDGRVDLWVGLSTIPAFEGNTLVGDSEVEQITLQAFSLGNASPIKKREDLRGKNILILRGYSYGGWVSYIKNPANEISYTEVDTHAQGFKALRLKRAQFLLGYRGPAQKTLAKAPVYNLVAQTISAFSVRFVVSAKATAPQQLLDKLETAFKSL
ncbi:MAG: substrate-binding periplasmic protein [Pseudomonadales bacterium]